MEFPVARPDVVRAVNQRWLLKFWQRHRGAHRVTQWQAVEPDNLAHMSANLSLLDVVPARDAARFLIRFHGATVGQVYGSADCRGRHVDEVIPPARCATALAPYKHTAAAGSPVYTIHGVADRDGRLVQYERLLLPFARDGQTVDRILASLEFICDDGGFQGRDLMSAQKSPPALRFAATIEA